MNSEECDVKDRANMGGRENVSGKGSDAFQETINNLTRQSGAEREGRFSTRGERKTRSTEMPSC